MGTTTILNVINRICIYLQTSFTVFRRAVIVGSLEITGIYRTGSLEIVLQHLISGAAFSSLFLKRPYIRDLCEQYRVVVYRKNYHPYCNYFIRTEKTTGGCGLESRRPCRFILGVRSFGIYRINRVGEEKIYYYFLGLETPVVRP